MTKPAVLLPATADCYACHQAHGAVDTTFTQFYPTAKAVAVAKGARFARTASRHRDPGRDLSIRLDQPCVTGGIDVAAADDQPDAPPAQRLAQRPEQRRQR